MNLMILMAMVFLVSMTLFLSALYFVVAAPFAKKALRARIEAIQESAAFPSAGLEMELLRREVLSRIPALDGILIQFPPLVKLNLFLKQAAVKFTVGALLALVLSLSLSVCLGGLLLSLPPAWVLLLAAGAASAPFAVLAVKRRRRFAQFEEQFPDAIDLLARAVRAGHAFTTGLELIGAELPDPVASEFRRTYEQQNLGLPLREALENLLTRIPHPDVHVFVTALVIQRESGGNLAEILDNLSRVVRERFKLMRQVRVFTAQGRMSLYMLTAMPPLLALGLYLLNRDYISRLFTDPLGQKMLVAGVALQLLGYLVIRRIIQPKI